jgi:hypothetical protein
VSNPAVRSSAAFEGDPALVAALSSSGHDEIIKSECPFSERVLGLWTEAPFSLGNQVAIAYLLGSDALLEDESCLKWVQTNMAIHRIEFHFSYRDLFGKEIGSSGFPRMGRRYWFAERPGDRTHGNSSSRESALYRRRVNGPDRGNGLLRARCRAMAS